MDSITEQSVKRNISGGMAKKRRVFFAVLIAVPVLTALYFLLSGKLNSLVFFGGAVTVFSIVIGFVLYPLLFKISFDYSLFGSVIEIRTVRKGKHSRVSFEGDLKDAECFFAEEGKNLSGYVFRHVYYFGENDYGDGVYGVIFPDKEDKTVRDLLLISPDEKMLSAISKYKRIEK